MVLRGVRRGQDQWSRGPGDPAPFIATASHSILVVHVVGHVEGQPIRIEAFEEIVAGKKESLVVERSEQPGQDAVTLEMPGGEYEVLALNESTRSVLASTTASPGYGERLEVTLEIPKT